jgi:hypothetical protein
MNEAAAADRRTMKEEDNHMGVSDVLFEAREDLLGYLEEDDAYRYVRREIADLILATGAAHGRARHASRRHSANTPRRCDAAS